MNPAVLHLGTTDQLGVTAGEGGGAPVALERGIVVLGQLLLRATRL